MPEEMDCLKQDVKFKKRLLLFKIPEIRGFL